MPDKVEFELVAPEALVFSAAADMVVVPGSEGDFGVLAGHAPLISLVRPGIIDVHDEGTVKQRIFVAGGFAEVTERRLTVLVEEAAPVDALDRGAIEARLERARKEAGAAETEEEKAAAEKEIVLAQAMLGAIE
ncbi:MAG: F0F1 ATP synthase subunit epsilon [Proteobacteria bacterium]|nr:F0F1 ATP synthase subunit epsilon [Pseudomonadota bacterium]